MKHLIFAIVIAVASSCLAVAEAGDAGIQLKQTIPLPGVEGRIDHFDFDAAGERLFVCAPGGTRSHCGGAGFGGPGRWSVLGR